MGRRLALMDSARRRHRTDSHLASMVPPTLVVGAARTFRARSSMRPRCFNWGRLSSSDRFAWFANPGCHWVSMTPPTLVDGQGPHALQRLHRAFASMGPPTPPGRVDGQDPNDNTKCYFGGGLQWSIDSRIRTARIRRRGDSLTRRFNGPRILGDRQRELGVEGRAVRDALMGHRFASSDRA